MPELQEADGNRQVDIQLIRSIQDGDVNAFDQLYERHAPVIFRFVYSHINNREDAEDLTEEIFIRVWQSLPNYEEKGAPFVAYLFRIARNAIIDHYRRSKRTGQELSLEENLVENPNSDPSEMVAANIEQQEVRQLLDGLREEYRLVLALRFLGDLSPDETAEVMGKSSGAIRVLQHRALAALRKLLDQKLNKDNQQSSARRNDGSS
jgi:RNA polymerase sigma-70 factor (ECF subfamily)